MSERIDIAYALCGLPKFGKTTVARKLVDDFLKTYPTGRVFVQDVHRNYLDYCTMYETVDAWRAAFAAAEKAKKSIPRGAAFGVDVDASKITELVISLGKHWNRGDVLRVPIMAVYDESSAMDTSGPTHMDKLDTLLFSNRSHWGIVPLYNAQRPGALMEGMWAQCTDVFIFGQPSQKWTRRMEENLGLAEGTLDKLIAAPKHFYLHWRSGEGIVP